MFCFYNSRELFHFSTEHFQQACAFVLKKADVQGNFWYDKWTITKKLVK